MLLIDREYHWAVTVQVQKQGHKNHIADDRESVFFASGNVEMWSGRHSPSAALLARWSHERQAMSLRSAWYVPSPHGACPRDRLGGASSSSWTNQSEAAQPTRNSGVVAWENLLFNLSDQPTATNAAQLTPRSTPTFKFWYVALGRYSRSRLLWKRFC